MSISPMRIGAITLFVSDVGRSKAWYGTTFDLPVAFEDADSAVFDFDGTLINLLDVGQAPDLIGPAKVKELDSGTYAQFTIWVDDVNAVCADLRARGVIFANGPLDRAWGQRTASFADPDGHHWEIAQPIESDQS